MRALFRTGPIRVVGVESRVGVGGRRKSDIRENRAPHVPNVGYLLW